MTDESRWPLDRKVPFDQPAAETLADAVDEPSTAEPGDEAYSADSPDEAKSDLAERMTGVHDPQDPDGLATLDGPQVMPDATQFGSPEEERPDPADVE